MKNFGNGENAMKYLGSYVCKGPIGDSRITRVDEHCVTFTVKDRKTKRRKPIRIEGTEFVRRYLLHALPSGFHRIRYYGFLHSGSKDKLILIRKLLEADNPDRNGEDTTEEHEVSSWDVSEGEEPSPSAAPVCLCPRCGHPMILCAYHSRAPPHQRIIPKIWARKNQVAA